MEVQDLVQREEGRDIMVIERYEIPREIKQRVAKFLSGNNIANRGVLDGDFERQYTGKIGECMVYRELMGKDLELKGDGFDGGVDMEYKGFSIDVKTMGRNVYVRGDYVNNFTDLQKDYPTDILLFCSINKKANIIEFCGWIWKCELERKGELKPSGTYIKRRDGSGFNCIEGLWEVRNDKLYPFGVLKTYSEEVLNKVKIKRMSVI